MLDALHVRPATPMDRADVTRLLASEGLETEFVAPQFVLALHDGAVVGCARLKPLGAEHEIASVAVERAWRGRGVGERLVREALRDARGPVHALALAPGFFAKLGFVPTAEVPSALREKAAGTCASTGFLPMTRLPDAA